MVLNSFGLLTKKSFLYYPNFLMHSINDMEYTGDNKLITCKRTVFGKMLHEVKSKRLVKQEFFGLDYHICIVNEDFHWFLFIVDFSGPKSLEGIPLTVTTTYLDSINRDLRNYNVIARLNQLEAYYRQLIFLAWNTTLDIKFVRKGDHLIRALQYNNSDCGFYVIYHVHAYFLRLFKSSLPPPQLLKSIPLYYRELINTKNTCFFDLLRCVDQKLITFYIPLKACEPKKLSNNSIVKRGEAFKIGKKKSANPEGQKASVGSFYMNDLENVSDLIVFNDNLSESVYLSCDSSFDDQFSVLDYITERIKEFIETNDGDALK